jgi:hypothetical protein
MRYLKYIGLVSGLLVLSLMAVPSAHAQRFGVAVGVGPVYGGYVDPGYGPAPDCVYGYYDYYPYACAPYGYYGPDWFSGGVFIGAGPWFHGYYGRGLYGGRGFYGRPGFYGRGGFRGGYGARGFEGRGAVGAEVAADSTAALVGFTAVAADSMVAVVTVEAVTGERT